VTHVDLVFSRRRDDAARELQPDVVDIHADARAELLTQPFYSVERFRERLENYVSAPDFDLVVAYVDDAAVGYAFGNPLPENTTWWAGLQDSTDPDLVRETGTRTFAFRDIGVRKTFQRQRIAHRLHDELLRNRPEERATLLVRSDNPARDLYSRWGWLKVGYVQPFPDSPRFEAMTLDLKSPAVSR
jgi:ribosomal protein S18 acetylase RimI-like enzyme